MRIFTREKSTLLTWLTWRRKSSSGVSGKIRTSPSLTIHRMRWFQARTSARRRWASVIAPELATRSFMRPMPNDSSCRLARSCRVNHEYTRKDTRYCGGWRYTCREVRTQPQAFPGIGRVVERTRPSMLSRVGHPDRRDVRSRHGDRPGPDGARFCHRAGIRQNLHQDSEGFRRRSELVTIVLPDHPHRQVLDVAEGGTVHISWRATQLKSVLIHDEKLHELGYPGSS